jgi:hypothetical protein
MQPYWSAEVSQFLLRRPILLFNQLYKLVLRALFRLSASTLVNCFPSLQASVSSVDWSHFRNSIWNICPWTTVLNCMCITAFRYLHLLNVCENTSPTMEWGLLVHVQSCWAVGVGFFIRPGYSKLLPKPNILPPSQSKALSWTSSFQLI